MDEANITASAQNILMCSHPDDVFVFVCLHPNYLIIHTNTQHGTTRGDSDVILSELRLV